MQQISPIQHRVATKETLNGAVATKNELHREEAHLSKERCQQRQLRRNARRKATKAKVNSEPIAAKKAE